MEARLTDYYERPDDRGSREGLKSSNGAEFPSQSGTHDILSKKGLLDYYQSTVIDKLKIQTDQNLNKANLFQYMKEHGELFNRSARKDTGRITVETKSNPFTIISGHNSSIILEVNPNKYRGHTDIQRLFSGLIEDYDPSKAKVMAMHFNVDANLAFESVFESATIKFKRKGCIHFDSGKITGVYYGHRTNQLVVYDKAFDERLSEQNITRFERRYAGNQCPIEKLSDINRLKNILPFTGIEFVTLSKLYPTSLSEQLKWHGINQLIKQHGAQYARRKLSSAGQFGRYAGYFENVQPINLNQEYLRRLDLYFEGNTL